MSLAGSIVLKERWEIAFKIMDFQENKDQC